MNKNAVKNIATRTGSAIVGEVTYTSAISAVVAPVNIGVAATVNKIIKGKWDIKGAIKSVAKGTAILIGVRTTAAMVAGLVVSTKDEIKSAKNSDDFDDIDVDEFEETEAETDAE